MYINNPGSFLPEDHGRVLGGQAVAQHRLDEETDDLDVHPRRHRLPIVRLIRDTGGRLACQIVHGTRFVGLRCCRMEWLCEQVA